MAGILIRKIKIDLRHRDPREKVLGRPRHHMKMEAKMGVMQQKEGLPAANRSGKEALNRFCFRTSRRNQSCLHLDFGLLAFTTVKEYISVF